MESVRNFEQFEMLDQGVLQVDYYWRELRNESEYWDLRLYFKLLELYILSNKQLLKEELHSEYIHYIILENFYNNARKLIVNIDEIYSDDSMPVGTELSMYWYIILRRANRSSIRKKCTDIAECSENIIEWIEKVTRMIAEYSDSLFGDLNNLREQLYKTFSRKDDIIKFMEPRNAYDNVNPKYKNSPYKLIILFNTVVPSNKFYKDYFKELHRMTGKRIDILYKLIHIEQPIDGYIEVDKIEWINDLVDDRDLPCIIVLNLDDDYTEILDLSDLDNSGENIFRVVKRINKQIKQQIKQVGSMSNTQFKQIIEKTKKEIRRMNNKEVGHQTGNIIGSVVIMGDSEGDIELSYSVGADTLDMKNILNDIKYIFGKMQEEEKWNREFKVLGQIQEIIEESNHDEQKKLLYKLKKKSGEFLLGVCSSMTATALQTFLTSI